MSLPTTASGSRPKPLELKGAARRRQRARQRRACEKRMQETIHWSMEYARDQAMAQCKNQRYGSSGTLFGSWQETFWCDFHNKEHFIDAQFAYNPRDIGYGSCHVDNEPAGSSIY